MPIENNKYYELGPNTFWLMALSRSNAALVLFFAGVLINVARVMLSANFELTPQLISILNLATAGAFVIAILAELIGVIVARLEYGNSRVMLDDSSLRIVRGILSKDEIALPYRRIQSVEVEQSLLYRFLGVGHVVIGSTTDLEEPNMSHSYQNDELAVPVMDYSLAEAVANALTSRAEVEHMQIQQRPAVTPK